MSCSSGIGACLCRWPSVSTAATMATTSSSRMAWCRRRRGSGSTSGLSLLMKRRCTWTGSSRWVQLDVQIGLQHASLSCSGQGGLSTSSPHPTEGVKDAEELPMVGVKHLLSMGCPQLTFWNQNLNFRKIFENSKSCDWSLLVLITFDCPDADVTMQDFTCPG